MELRKDYQPSRNKPFAAKWDENGMIRSRYFSTEAARDAFIENFSLQFTRRDPTIGMIPPHRLIRWQQAAEIDPEADPLEVYRFWRKAQKRSQSEQNRTLSKATSEYVAAMARLKRHPDYIRHVTKALEELQGTTGDRNLRDLTTEKVRRYLFAG